jgi:hypothetical protein
MMGAISSPETSTDFTRLHDVTTPEDMELKQSKYWVTESLFLAEFQVLTAMTV